MYKIVVIGAVWIIAEAFYIISTNVYRYGTTGQTYNRPQPHKQTHTPTHTLRQTNRTNIIHILYWKVKIAESSRPPHSTHLIRL